MTGTTLKTILRAPHSETASKITIGRDSRLTLLDAITLSQKIIPVEVNPNSFPPMERSHELLRSWLDQRLPIYGINTQFGDQVTFLDSHLTNSDTGAYYDSIDARQRNLIRSHSCGLGEVVPPEIVRVAMLLRAHCLSQGYSGITPGLITSVLNYINSGITPVVRKYGSIGASGDLIPLAMIAAALVGEKVDVIYQNKIMKAPEAMAMAGITPFVPQMRDGLALINGTSFMTAIASVTLYRLKNLFRQMLYTIGMALESMKVITSAYHPLVHQLKRQSGEMLVDEFLLNFWEGSKLLSDLDVVRNANLMNESTQAVQDYYSLRSVAQGFGPLYENLEIATIWIENEMNSINDNPIIDTNENKIHHNANFMGYYITEACDLLKTDIGQASSWLHALLANLVHPRKSHGLPANLVPDPGNQNGFRPLQLLVAALTVKNRKFGTSQQSYMIPTEGDNQDVNSLGTHAAFDLYDSVKILTNITAIILLASMQALELRGIENAGRKSQEIFHTIRKHSPSIGDCRPMSDEIERISQLLEDEII